MFILQAEKNKRLQSMMILTLSALWLYSFYIASVIYIEVPDTIHYTTVTPQTPTITLLYSYSHRVPDTNYYIKVNRHRSTRYQSLHHSTHIGLPETNHYIKVTDKGVPATNHYTTVNHTGVPDTNQYTIVGDTNQ